ncbi:hypothetical protein FACS1894200_07300 [Spirochaetia bacterium]|nr:hypothetical protein FACS1894200_07300 [Spirochaetia bacterium]
MKNLILIAFVISALLSLHSCSSVPAPAQSNPYYTGGGGKGMSLTIDVPEAKGLAAAENNLPGSVQSVFVADITKYSAITVRDPVSLDKVYQGMLGPQNEDGNVAGMDLGHLPPTDYSMNGTITKTSTAYALNIQITKTDSTKAVSAAYSGTCTFAEFEDRTGIHRASLDLLQQLGVELTPYGKQSLMASAEGSSSGDKVLTGFGNLFFGLGSFTTGDWAGGLTLVGGYGVAAGLIIYEVVGLSYEDKNAGIPANIGAVLAGATVIYGFIRPFMYEYEGRTALVDVLNGVNIAAIPDTTGIQAVHLSYTFQF